MKSAPHTAKVFVIFLLASAAANKSNAQLVKEKFDIMNISENFDSSNSYWTTLANAENLFIVQEGEYILNRKTTVSPFAIIGGFNSDFTAFRLVTSVKLEKSTGEESSIGILFMAQPDGTGGFIFEINRQKQFRVRQIAGSTYKYLTGDGKSGGWVNSKFIGETNSYNLIEIKTLNRNYDIHINNNFLVSFSEIAYKTGRIGIVIGSGTKGRVDFMYLFSSSRESALSDDGEAKVSSNYPAETPPDIIDLAESIIKLKTQINKLDEQNEDLRKTIEAMKSDDDETESQKKQFEKNIRDLQSKNNKSQASFDSLLKVNQDLVKYKDLVAGNENSDLIITLSKSLKNEKAANEILRKQNKELTDSLAVMLRNQKPVKQNATNENKAEKNIQPDENKGFVLPKEN